MIDAALALIGVIFLAFLVGILTGHLLTARRYQRTLRRQRSVYLDLTRQSRG